MKKVFFIIYALVATLSMTAQNVTFYSEEFKLGVTRHLGLDVDADVPQTLTDTITSIDLSGLGIRDLRDAVYLPNVKTLNLSSNGISNVLPLMSLDSLKVLNLANNELESINPLVFSTAEWMIVDVSFNYIDDFSYFFSPTRCQFTISGIGFQMDKNASFFEVDQLFVDINAEGKPEVFYRGYTNMEESVFVLCNGAQTAAEMDGDTRSAVVPGSPTAAAMVVLTNGERADTTWVVPPTEYEAVGGSTVTISTGLPEDYTIASAYTKSGIEATIDGRNLSFQTAADYECDTLYISYYEGNRLRGFTEFYLVNPDLVSMLKGDVNNDRLVSIADVTAMVNNILGKQHANFLRRNADINGDGSVTIADVTALVNIILGKTGQ